MQKDTPYIPDSHFKSLAELETHYWWHQSRLNWAETFIRQHVPNFSKLRVLDYGCGTGGFLNAMDQRLGFQDCMGVDISATAVEAAKVYGGHYSQISPGDFSAVSDRDLVFLMDTLEHIEDDQAFLKDLLGNLIPGGRILISVPAMPFLYSAWDKVLGHFRRYRLQDMENLASSLGLNVVINHYAFGYLVPAILTSRVLGRKHYDENQCEFPPVPSWLNKFLMTLNRWEISANPYFRIPIGSSLFCLMEKKE